MAFKFGFGSDVDVSRARVAAANTLVPNSAPAKALIATVLEAPTVSSMISNGPVQFTPAKGSPFGWKVSDFWDFKPYQKAYEGGRLYTDRSTVTRFDGAHRFAGLGALTAEQREALMTAGAGNATQSSGSGAVQPATLQPTVPTITAFKDEATLKAYEATLRARKGAQAKMLAQGTLDQMKVWFEDLRGRWVDLQNQLGVGTTAAYDKADTATRVLPVFVELETKLRDGAQTVMNASAQAAANGVDASAAVSEAQTLVASASQVLTATRAFANQLAETKEQFDRENPAQVDPTVPTVMVDYAAGTAGSKSGIPLWAVALGGVAVVGAAWYFTK